MKKKSLFSILITSLLVVSNVPNAFTEEKIKLTPSSTAVNPIVEVNLISEDFVQIQPTASIIEMSKPIAHQAKLTNAQLGKMVKAYQKGTTWLSNRKYSCVCRWSHSTSRSSYCTGIRTRWQSK